MSLQVHCDFCNKSLFDAKRRERDPREEPASFVLYDEQERWGRGAFEDGRLDFCNEGCAGAYFLEQQREKAGS